MHGKLLPHQRLRNWNRMQRWQLLQLLVRQLHQSFHVQNTREHLAPLSHYRSLQPQVWAGDVCVTKETRNELPNNLAEWSLQQRKLQREPIKQKRTLHRRNTPVTPYGWEQLPLVGVCKITAHTGNKRTYLVGRVQLGRQPEDRTPINPLSPCLCSLQHPLTHPSNKQTEPRKTPAICQRKRAAR